MSNSYTLITQLYASVLCVCVCVCVCVIAQVCVCDIQVSLYNVMLLHSLARHWLPVFGIMLHRDVKDQSAVINEHASRRPGG